MKTQMDADNTQIISGNQRSYQRSSAFKGQTVMEYAVLIAVIVGALIGMQIYLKRGVSGRLREAGDSIGEQYAPGKTTSTYTLNIASNTTTESKLLKDQDIPGEDKPADEMETTTTINSDTTTRTGEETVDELGKDLWN